MENNVGVASRRHADIVPFNNNQKKRTPNILFVTFVNICM